jgi:hypothetical protein
VATHAGSRNGFLQSSRPLYTANEGFPAEGYVSWVGTVPVLHDADGLLTLTALFLGERGAADTGILDRRAAYAYLSSLAIPWAGAYTGFLAVNALFWWSAAAAAYWFAGRRWQDRALARAISLLVATGHGFLFMADLPMSYLCAYASSFLSIALAEWLGAFRPGARLGSWLLLGWSAGVASTIYFAHIPILIYWWLFGVRRVPWRHLIAATAVALAISSAWELIGRNAVGLAFTTDNSDLVRASLAGWLAHLAQPWPDALTYFRGGPLAGAAAIRGTLVSAFAYPWWLLAALGFAASNKVDREWALAVAMGGLVPAILILSLLPLPRLAYYMYPAVYFLAARGALTLGRATYALLTARYAVPIQNRNLALAWAPSAAAAATVCLALGTLVLASNADLFGYQQLDARFHNSIGATW